MKTESKNAKKLHQGRAFSYRKIKSYHDKFKDKNTGKFKTEFLEKRACPVCKKSNDQLIFNASGGTYVKCLGCTMIFTNPAFKESSLNEYYKNLDTGQAVITENEKQFYREIYTKGLTAVEKIKPSLGKILDIGCSSGFFLDIAKKNGWTTYGIEPGKKEAAMCRVKGHHLYTENLENLDLKVKFDAITMWDVFEHIPDGNKYLKLLSKNLEKNGLVFMQIPNSGSIATRIMHEKTKMFDGLEHVNLYNPKTIQLIAENNGFQIMHLSTVISEIAVLNNYLSYDDPYTGNSDFNAKLLGLFDDKFLHENLLGYKIQIVLRKK